MPARKDIKKIFILGSGPIVIGQACEFDYSGTQACKILRKEGYQIVLLNSNPATIMTDPEIADKTYIEPLTPEIAEKIIIKERPDAILPTVGGQTALNLCMELHRRGSLKKHRIELLGASIESIQRAESRKEFKAAIQELIVDGVQLRVPESRFCYTIEEARDFRKDRSLPLVIRPSFTLGGTGGGIVYTEAEFEQVVWNGLNASPVKEILIEESVLGWKEYEFEVMRDRADNVVIVCSIENFDPMGVHTGDSITVAPQQTLSDAQYQHMRNASMAIIRKIGVATGGSNIQFAVNPENAQMLVIEMNPRVSRSSALASKATGFPIAKIAAQLAVGYTLDEVRNEITQKSSSSFEPSIDYVVTKVPRFAFEKFPENKDTLGPMMRSVGEAMGIARNFQASWQKALRSLENGRYGWGSDASLDDLEYLCRRLRAQSSQRQGNSKIVEGSKQAFDTTSHKEDAKFSAELSALLEDIRQNLERPHPDRIYWIRTAFELGLQVPETLLDVDAIAKLSRIDPWFLHQLWVLVRWELHIEHEGLSLYNEELLWSAKRLGYSDRQLAFLAKKQDIVNILAELNFELSEDSLAQNKIRAIIEKEEARLSQYRYKKQILAVYKRVDTCAGEFQAHTPYLYSTYETPNSFRDLGDSKSVAIDLQTHAYSNESAVSKNEKVIILGGGPNRIGQGIEFDYCCCHASFTLQEKGIEAIMVNSNPETVSTDYDSSDKLYFEPLSLEDILHLCHTERPRGVIVSFGGQTPLNLARELKEHAIHILGTSWDAIDRTENRDRFAQMLDKLGIRQAPGGMAYTVSEAVNIAEDIAYPVLVRPSYVLGGRSMVISHDRKALIPFVQEARRVSPRHPILIDKFLEDAIELDVDALADSENVFVAGILQHIEEAGVHSGDSACVLPPFSIDATMIAEIKEATTKIALELGVCGLLNIQFALYKDELFVIEVNPRASRTVPFVSKALGLPLAAIATKLMLGERLSQLLPARPYDYIKQLPMRAVKEAVIPFFRFPESDIILGPEMKATGEVMGLAPKLGLAYIKALLGTGQHFSLRIHKDAETKPGIFFSVCDKAKETLFEDAKILIDLGFTLYSTQGTANFLRKKGLNVETVYKMREKRQPNPLDYLQSGKIQAVINIPDSQRTFDDAFAIRQEAMARNLLCVTTLTGTQILVQGLKEMQNEELEVYALQELYELPTYQFDNKDIS